MGRACHVEELSLSSMSRACSSSDVSDCMREATGALVPGALWTFSGLKFNIPLHDRGALFEICNFMGRDDERCWI